MLGDTPLLLKIVYASRPTVVGRSTQRAEVYHICRFCGVHFGGIVSLQGTYQENIIQHHLNLQARNIHIKRAEERILP